MDNILQPGAPDPTILKMPKSPCFRNANNGVDSVQNKKAFNFGDDAEEEFKERSDDRLEIAL